MVVVAIVVVAAVIPTLVPVTAASPAIIDRDEEATRQQLQTDEGEEERSEEGDSPAGHGSSPVGVG
jgi:hypothetical protein